jgi:hypothetical protein
MLRRWVAFFAISQLLAGAGSASAKVERVLLSVGGLNVLPHEGLKQFHITTWGVEYVAICHLPNSWEIKSEKFADPEGWLDGKADEQSQRLTGLRDMYLVDVYDYQPRPKGNPKGDYHPPSFSGWVQIGTSADETSDLPKLKLSPGNFQLRAAKACPPAPPAQP